jgi:hypothetical protein
MKSQIYPKSQEITARGSHTKFLLSFYWHITRGKIPVFWDGGGAGIWFLGQNYDTCPRQKINIILILLLVKLYSTYGVIISSGLGQNAAACGYYKCLI